MILKVAIFFVAMITFVVGQMQPTQKYTHSATLRSGNIALYWTLDEEYIVFEVMGQTTGWIGIGFSPNGAMTGADIIVGWVKNGNVTITDRHGTGNAFPPLDPEQNINILGGAESNGWTMFKFSRQLAACEANYDREITQATQRLIFAYGNGDPADDDMTSRDYHGDRRGVESMYFLQSPNTATELPDNISYESFDILNDNFKIPAVETFYSCRILELPSLSSKHHIVKYEPVIHEGNELNVHHMLVYTCGNVVENMTEIGLHEHCDSPNMNHFKTCTNVIAAWAIGGAAIIYPTEAGYSIGDTGDSAYYMLEIHYDNPRKQSGIIDSSGIRFTYTSFLRTYDVGLLILGQTEVWEAHIIPPGASDFLTTAFCTSKCIEDRLTEAGVGHITLFNVLLHSHYAGRKLKLRHIRNGTELPFIASDPSYDFNYQEYRFLDPYVILEKNDDLQMECIYGTEDRDYVTQGGEGTRDEMCTAFVSYFPKIKWAECTTLVDPAYTYGSLGIDINNLELIPGENSDYLSSYNITAPPEIAGMTFLEYVNGLNWTPDDVKNFETYVNTAQHSEICVPESEDDMKVYDIDLINIASPYVEPKKLCKNETATSPPMSDLTSSLDLETSSDLTSTQSTTTAAATVSASPPMSDLTFSLDLETSSDLTSTQSTTTAAATTSSAKAPNRLTAVVFLTLMLLFFSLNEE